MDSNVKTAGFLGMSVGWIVLIGLVGLAVLPGKKKKKK